VPDFVANAGGLIQVADEIGGYNEQRARAKASNIFNSVKGILTAAADEGVPPVVAAARLAEHRWRLSDGSTRHGHAPTGVSVAMSAPDQPANPPDRHCLDGSHNVCTQPTARDGISMLLTI
jgi:hypothetical protein